MFFTMTSIVCHLLQIPDQGHNIVHTIVWHKEIADTVNTDHLIPSATAVIAFAKVLCVHILSPTLAIS
jgi:hypothetical protein